MAKAKTQQREVYYSGNVQGVGFRYTTRSIARGFAVTGFVKNLSDGRVQVVVEGEPAEVQAFLNNVQGEMRQWIHQTQETVLSATGRFPTFDVRY